MSFLFGRLGKVTFGSPGEEGRVVHSFSYDKDKNMLVPGLRFTFSIEKTSDAAPNKMSIEIYNLNETSQAILKKKGCKIQLDAGYGNILTDGSVSDLRPTIALLFKGDVAKCKVVKRGPDWITTVENGDGLTAFQDAKFDASFAPGASTASVTDQVVSAFGLGKGEIQSQGGQFLNGVSFTGLARNAMDVISGKLGNEWSIQNELVQMIPENSATQEPVILIDSNSGLVGSPNISGFSNSREKKFAGVEFISLLQPGLKPGRRVQVVSKKVNGVFIVRKVKHHGDTRTGPWYSEVEAAQP